MKTLILKPDGDGDGADPWNFLNGDRNSSSLGADGADTWDFLNGDRNSSRVDVDGADTWDFFPEHQYELSYK